MRKYIIVLLLLLFICKAEAHAEEVVIPEWLEEMTEDIAPQYNYPPELIQSLCWVESRCDENATPTKACKGICQVNSNVWATLIYSLDYEDVMEPYHNIIVACEILEVYRGDDEEMWNALYKYNGAKSTYYPNQVLKISEELERKNGK